MLKIYNKTLSVFVGRVRQIALDITKDEFHDIHCLIKHDVVTFFVFENEKLLGTYQNNSIGLNKSHIYAYKNQILRDTLKHELAHLIVHWKYKNDKMEKPHGPCFQKVCKTLAKNQDELKRIQSATLTNDNNDIEGDLKSEKVIEKIKKLLALGSSKNTHEAELATTKANQLLIKHNLEYLQPGNKEFEFYNLVVGESLNNKKVSSIINILSTFQVMPILNRIDSTKRYRVEVNGSKGSVEVAAYLYRYLDLQFDLMWKGKKPAFEEAYDNGDSSITTYEYNEYDCDISEFPSRKSSFMRVAKNNFFEGIAEGFIEKINEAKTKVDIGHGMGLVQLEDEFSENIEKYAQEYLYGDGSICYRSTKKINLIPLAKSLGHDEGRKLSINPGIENKSITPLIDA